jgi:hypothetical protein
MTEGREARQDRLARELNPQVQPREVTVVWTEYQTLLRDALVLSLLEDEGVEGWPGYQKAHDRYGDLTDWP